MKYSFIVPVYNVEVYLDACVDSLRTQTYDDYEIILVDDGSTDHSGEMCDAYAGKDGRMRVHHRKNGGLSAARNTGIDMARGDYLVFVDADDWIDPKALSEFDAAMNNARPDVLVTRLTEVRGEIIEPKDKHFAAFLAGSKFDKEGAAEWCLKHSQNTWPAQKYVVRTEFARASGLRFAVDRLHEDLDWTGRMLLKAETFCGCTEGWYYHRIGRAGAITTQESAKAIIDMIEIAGGHFRRYIEKKEPLYGQIVQRMAESVFSRPRMAGKCGPEDREKVIVCAKANRKMLSMSKKPLHRGIVFLMNAMGMDRALKLVWRL